MVAISLSVNLTDKRARLGKTSLQKKVSFFRPFSILSFANLDFLDILTNFLASCDPL